MEAEKDKVDKHNLEMFIKEKCKRKPKEKEAEIKDNQKIDNLEDLVMIKVINGYTRETKHKKGKRGKVSCS